MDCDATVAELVIAASGGDHRAWDELVERFNPLVVSITRRYRLHADDAADVGQTLWLSLVQHLGEIREPSALPGWIVATTRHECWRLLRSQRRTTPFDPLSPLPEQVSPAYQAVWDDQDSNLVQAERHEALLAAFGTLSSRQRELLQLLVGDPPPSYEEIGRRLNMPVGAVGPTRARALERLRKNPALQSMRMDAESGGRLHEVPQGR